MNSRESDSRYMLLTAVDGVISLVILGFSISLIQALINQTGGHLPLLRGFFISSIVFRVIHIFANLRTDRLSACCHGISAGFLVACLFILGVLGANRQTVPAVGWLLLLSLSVDRICSIIRKPQPVRIVLNILCILLLIVLGRVIFVVVLFSSVQVTREIVRLAFYNMDMDILFKIVRKTNAPQILFGMLMLIIAFSMLFPLVEDNIRDFPSALWYSFAIVSTIGFGDVTATSIPGRVLTVILGLCGLLIVSLVVSIIVNLYNETKNSDKADSDADSAHQ